MHVIYWPEGLLLHIYQEEGESISNYFAEGRCLREDFWVVFGFCKRRSLNSIGQLGLEGESNLDELEVTFVISNNFAFPIQIYQGKTLVNQVKVVLYAIPQAKLFEHYAFPPVEPLPKEILTSVRKQFTSNCIRSEIGFSVIEVLNCHFGVSCPKTR